MAGENTFLGLRICSSDVDSDLGIASVTFQTLLKDEDGMYIATEENSRFTKNGSGVHRGWLYLDGEVSDPSDEDFNYLFDEYGDPADLYNDKESENPNDDEYHIEERKNILTPAAEAALAGI